MLHKGNVIKHRMYKDVAIGIHKCFDVGHKLKIKGYWINQAFEESYDMHLGTFKVVILKENLKDWLICKEPTAKCIRNVEWHPIVPRAK